MGQSAWMRRCFGLAALALAHAGCVATSPRQEALAPVVPPQASEAGWVQGPVVRTVHRVEPPSATLPAPRLAAVAAPPQVAPPVPPSLFAGADELNVDDLVSQVLVRNPSLAEMIAAWRAASARYPQVTSLDDPMFGLQAAPGAWASRDLDGGVRVEVSQKFLGGGKLPLRGENALALASAAGHDAADTQLQLEESARRAFYDYYLVDRAAAVNRTNLELLREISKTARERFKNRLATEQDMLQAEVEIGRAREREVTLERLRPVTVARINTLLHLPPDAPLPPPPAKVGLAGQVPDAPILRAQALEQRPDLRAVSARIKAEEAALGLAHAEYRPDVEVFAAYDSIWQEKPLRGQLGVRLNLPVRRERRRAAVAEAEARIAQRRAELDRQIDQLNYQVQQACEQVRESEQVVRLYQATILPAARENVKAAITAYATGKSPFLSLVEAQRGVVGIEDRLYEAIAEYHRRRATLERVVGGPVATPKAPDAKPAAPGKAKSGQP